MCFHNSYFNLVSFGQIGKRDEHMSRCYMLFYRMPDLDSVANLRMKHGIIRTMADSNRFV